MFEIFEEFYIDEINTLKFNKDKNVEEFGKLIKKQIKNSIFNRDEGLLYYLLATSLTNTILYYPPTSEGVGDDVKNIIITIILKYVYF